MISAFSRLATFAGRNWLRLLLLFGALFLLTQKQVNFSVQLGRPGGGGGGGEAPVVVENTAPTVITQELAPATGEEGGGGGFLERFNIFGGASQATPFEQLGKQSEAEVAAYITRFSHVAQAEQEKFGIPASVTLATGLLYGRAGHAAAARELNNFFGLGCGGDWTGATGYADGACVRRYENAWTSFRDFSLFVTGGRYAPLTQFGPSDYRRWAAGLEELGFNGTEELAGQLQRTIDKYQLFRFD